MSKASGSIDLKSLKIAGEGASKYITEISSDGIFISPSDQNPVESAEGNSVKIDGDGMEIYKDGISVAQYAETARIGSIDGYRTLISNSDFQITDENNSILSIESSGRTETKKVTITRLNSQNITFNNDKLTEQTMSSKRTITSFKLKVGVTYNIKIRVHSGIEDEITYTPNGHTTTKILRCQSTMYGNNVANLTITPTSNDTVKVTGYQTVSATVPAEDRKAVVMAEFLVTTTTSTEIPVMTFTGDIITPKMAGIIQMYAGSIAPAGWLICNGDAVSRETYATLYSVIGTTYGAGDGSTTFNLPDLRGRAPIGAGQGSGLTNRTLGAQDIGSEYIQAHTHSFTNPSVQFNVVYRQTVSSGGGVRNCVSGGTGGSFQTINGSVGAVSGATTGSGGNMQPSAVVNFIICTGEI